MIKWILRYCVYRDTLVFFSSSIYRAIVILRTRLLCTEIFPIWPNWDCWKSSNFFHNKKGFLNTILLSWNLFSKTTTCIYIETIIQIILRIHIQFFTLKHGLLLVVQKMASQREWLYTTQISDQISCSPPCRGWVSVKTHNFQWTPCSISEYEPVF